MGYYESVEYTAKVVGSYKSSPEFEEEFFVKSNAFYDRGCAYILLQFHLYIPDKALMCRAYESSFVDPGFRMAVTLSHSRRVNWWRLPPLI